MRYLAEAFQQITNKSKQIRIVKGLPTDICIGSNIYVPDNGRLNSILSLLLQGDQNCITNIPAHNAEEEAAITAPVTIEQKTEEDTTDKLPNTADVGNEEPETTNEEPKKKKRKFWEILKGALTEDEE
jgi:hypothetical protein